MISLSLLPELDTPFACFKNAAETFPDEKCLGHREYLDDGKRGDYMWLTYSEVRVSPHLTPPDLVRECLMPDMPNTFHPDCWSVQDVERE